MKFSSLLERFQDQQTGTRYPPVILFGSAAFEQFIERMAALSVSPEGVAKSLKESDDLRFHGSRVAKDSSLHPNHVRMICYDGNSALYCLTEDGTLGATA